MPKVHIIWGERPEHGVRPTEYAFKTQAELDAFLLGVSEGEGWMDYHVVDAKDRWHGEVAEALGPAEWREAEREWKKGRVKE